MPWWRNSSSASSLFRSGRWPGGFVNVSLSSRRPTQNLVGFHMERPMDGIRVYHHGECVIFSGAGCQRPRQEMQQRRRSRQLSPSTIWRRGSTAKTGKRRYWNTWRYPVVTTGAVRHQGSNSSTNVTKNVRHSQSPPVQPRYSPPITCLIASIIWINCPARPRLVQLRASLASYRRGVGRPNAGKEHRLRGGSHRAQGGVLKPWGREEV